MKKEIQQTGFCDSYKTKVFRRAFKEFHNTILLKYANDPKKIICSLGSHNDMLANHIYFKELYLVDLKFGKCEHKSNPNIHYYETSIENIFSHKDFKNKMDVVIMKDLIEHLDPHIAKFALTHMKDVLTKNGLFILKYPNAHSVNRLIGVELGMLKYPEDLSDLDKSYNHKKMYSYNDITIFEKWLKMKKIEDIGIMFKPLSNAQMDKYFSENLETFIQIGYDLSSKACSQIGGVFKNVS